MKRFTLLPAVEAPPDDFPLFGFSVFFDVFPPLGKGHEGQQGDDDTF
jgi:hypothetical protein